MSYRKCFQRTRIYGSSQSGAEKVNHGFRSLNKELEKVVWIMSEVNLNFMDDVCPALDKIGKALAKVPDMCTESQRECLDEMAVTLRTVAGTMSKAARGGE